MRLIDNAQVTGSFHKAPRRGMYLASLTVVGGTDSGVRVQLNKRDQGETDPRTVGDKDGPVELSEATPEWLFACLEREEVQAEITAAASEDIIVDMEFFQDTIF